MWPLSPHWQDPLAPGAPGSIIQSAAGLRARVLGQNTRAIVFLHGLGASLRYWGRAYDALAARARLIFVDLLGFGGSAKPTGTYDIACHVAALQATITELRTTEAILVGHSTGGLIAMALGTERPRLVDRVIGFGVPVFPSAEAPRQHIHRLGPMARLMADDVPLAKRMCRLMCDHRELARAVAPWLAPRLPAAVAADGVNHIWDSYGGTFRIVVHENRAREWGESLADRLSLVYGSEDRSCPPAAAQATLGETLSPEVIPGCDHHLPLRRAEVALRLIQRVVKYSCLWLPEAPATPQPRDGDETMNPDPQRAREKYRHIAGRYDRSLGAVDGIRRQAVRRLGLGSGDIVLDIACGTGLSFPLLEEEVGPDGRIVGIDLSPEMLGKARVRVESAGWNNVTLIESAIEAAEIPVQADAVIFYFTHDVMRSPEAIENVFRHVKPGGRVVSAGGKRAPLWALPVNAVMFWISRRYITTYEGFRRPWSHLERFVPDLKVEPRLFGAAYIAWGTTPSRYTPRLRSTHPPEYSA